MTIREYLKTLLQGVKTYVDEKIVKSDWNENDENSTSYINNRTHYDARVETTKTITFDGTTEGKNVINTESGYYFVKMSDDYFSSDKLIGKNLQFFLISNSTDLTIQITSDKIVQYDGYYSINTYVIFCEKDIIIEGEDLILTKGLWFQSNSGMYVSSLEVPALEGEVKPLDEMYLPETTKYQSDWNVNDEADPAFVKNRPFYTTGSTTSIYSETNDTFYEVSWDGPVTYYTTTFIAEAPLLEVGKKYTVVWDGATYSNLECYLFEDTPVVGDPGFVQCPFVINYFVGELRTSMSGESHTFEILLSDEEYVKIDEKYLPTMIGKPGTGVNSEIFNSYTSNEASGNCSHAEGVSTTASGDYSHAEGFGTVASGSNSHTEGTDTTASGMNSHAEGYNTIAAGVYQHVQGKYNVEDAENKYAHIIGNGETKSRRSNAHTLDWDGNAWFAGKVYVGGTSQDDASILATTDYVDSAVSAKADSSHNHAASNITSGTLSSDRLPTVPITKGGTGATTAANARTNLGASAVYNGTTLTDLYLNTDGFDSTLTSDDLKGSIQGLPIGSIIEWSSLTPPTNYLICDGSWVSQTVYADLYAVIGHTYDGDTSVEGSFRLPNRCGKVGVGYDADNINFNALGKTGGEETHTLTIAEMPTHSHNNARGVKAASPGSKDAIDTSWATGSAFASNIITNNTGGGNAHNNLQPYETTIFVIKYKDGNMFSDEYGGVVIDNLNSTSTKDVLSAYQGKVLNDTKLDKSGGTIDGNLTVNGDYLYYGTAGYVGSNGTTSLHIQGTASNYISVKTTNGKGITISGTDGVYPSDTDTLQLGAGNKRWNVIYCKSGSVSTSDRTHKENIVDIDNKYIQLFDKLKPVTFEYNYETSDRTHVGFISQDVKESMDEIGLTDLEFAGYCRDEKKLWNDEEMYWEPVLDEEGNPTYIYSLRYSEFIALNTKMIQLNKAKIAEQEAEIDILKSELSELKTLLNKLMDSKEE